MEVYFATLHAQCNAGVSVLLTQYTDTSFMVLYESLELNLQD